MRTKKGILGLLDATISSVVSSSEGTFERINKKSWSKIVDLDELTEKAERLARATTSDQERTIATRFLTAVARNSGF